MNPHSALAVQARDLVKIFGATRAVDGVDLNVNTGLVYGLLGHTGAGKTTLLRMLGARLRPSAGIARIFGHDVVLEAERIRGRVSITGQSALIDENLTVRENLLARARHSRHHRTPPEVWVSRFLEIFGEGFADGRASECPPRLLRCLDFALGVVSCPDLLLLDEPTVGLDTHTREWVWDVVRSFAEEGTTVLLATQYIDEASRLADRIAVLDHGRVVVEGSVGELRADSESDVIRIRLRDPGDRFRAEQLLFETLGVHVHGESDPAVLSAHVSDPESAAIALAELSLADIEVITFTFGRASMGRMLFSATDDPGDLPAPGGCGEGGSGAAAPADE
ncbi:ATP-binding cassette domain-containing protein [Streptosporangium sp. NPDC048865]|uniref:ATP-binding cassette domain-containing protein n=1 Tax=Streptosporangium sp. NPDC048865 TaxID=3155766 RepID=UPI003412574D